MSAVAIAGVTGFVGRRVAAALLDDQRVIGLVRRPRVTVPEALGRVEFRNCDLFSLSATAEALQGADVAVYLVHSMSPHAGLEARFEDLDLLLADTFARACAAASVRRIVYVSGIIPEHAALSPHLRSRLEVERTLAAHAVPLVTLRAGLVIGADGPSFRILARLVERLPAMICPAWTDTACQPIDVRDLVGAVVSAVTARELRSGPVDVAGPEILSYREIIERTAARLGRHPRLLRLPFFTPRLSRLWVRLVTGTPSELVAPLVESLAHPMVARRADDTPAWAFGRTPLDAALADALAGATPSVEIDVEATPASVTPRSLGAVERLPLPAGLDAARIEDAYAAFLGAAGESARGEIEFRVVASADCVLACVRAGDRRSLAALRAFGSELRVSDYQ